MGELTPGDYKLQVECPGDIRSRVHRIKVDTGTTKMHVDTRFDRAIRTEQPLRLIYADASTENNNRAHDAEAIAQILPSESVVLLTAESEDVLRLDLRKVGSRSTEASAWIPLDSNGPQSGSVRTAVQSLLDRRSVDFTTATPTARSAWKPSKRSKRSARMERRLSKKNLITGAALASVGMGGLVTG